MNAIAKMYPKLSAVELSAILMKGAAMSAASLERDSGFNSGSSEHEDDLKSLDQSSRDGIISPENSSEDSVEVKLPQPSVIKNKRKSTEPLRIITESESLGPIKKRIRYEERLSQGKEIPDHHVGGNPFRPWAPSEEMPNGHPLPAHFLNPADLLVRHPGVTTLHRAISIKPLDQLQQQIQPAIRPSATSPPIPHQQQPLALVSKKSLSAKSQEKIEEDSRRNHLQHSLHPPNQPAVFVPPQPIVGEPSGSSTKPLHPRNYKNMTRERRIEANARERTRVHTISAAYEKLRQAVPSYSNSQKLSKLSILRIACSYILTLSRMAGEDYSADGSEPSLDDCVEMVTKTIQTEGKIKKKKDD
ncbi:transcription factor Atoh1 [Toxorhynchites rutilus septentrionalis]|uniref:transcription factor Atoh1 n=1 Tax=Toxorhynchites rutilus septentrionalis TaxID=329112 RepID=UPI0024787CD4|nr:transcription factor Atoh1 [Toxorhynchites rutilus septentrionalis]